MPKMIRAVQANDIIGFVLEPSKRLLAAKRFADIPVQEKLGIWEVAVLIKDAEGSEPAYYMVKIKEGENGNTHSV